MKLFSMVDRSGERGLSSAAWSRGLVLVGLMAALVGCGVAGQPAWTQEAQNVGLNDGPNGSGTLGPALREVAREPEVRIRIARREASVVVGAAGQVQVRDPRSKNALIRLRGPVTFARSAGVWRITDASEKVQEFRGEQLDVGHDARSRGLTTVGKNQYPGRISLLASSGANGIDVVNTVGMESYLPGVLQRELFGSWDPAAFRAQAITARSYALWEIKRARLKGRPYDLESTTASQAYVGVASNPKATAAVEATRGQVIAFEGHIVPAFYSSAHGGLGADGHVTFPGRAPDIAPLRGTRQGGVDKASNRHRWEASRDPYELAARLAAWGKANKHAVADAQPPIREVTVSHVNSVGRHQGIRVTDNAGTQYQMLADQFRHAANFTVNPKNPRDNTIGSAGDLAKLSADNTFYSGHFTPAFRDGKFVFLDGHGYGHGVGMSQFGAQGMALAGKPHEEIVLFFYPGATIEKIYR